jgi:hypothetical protein
MREQFVNYFKALHQHLPEKTNTNKILFQVLSLNRESNGKLLNTKQGK